MGSELVDTATGDVLWGLAPGPFVSAWLSGASLERLRLRKQERLGQYGRVTATRLLQAPAWLPVLQGAEPYTRLVGRLRQVVADPAALLEVAYDWRLPVTYYAVRLADAASFRWPGWNGASVGPGHRAPHASHPGGLARQLAQCDRGWHRGRL